MSLPLSLAHEWQHVFVCKIKREYRGLIWKRVLWWCNTHKSTNIYPQLPHSLGDLRIQHFINPVWLCYISGHPVDILFSSIHTFSFHSWGCKSDLRQAASKTASTGCFEDLNIITADARLLSCTSKQQHRQVISYLVCLQSRPPSPLLCMLILLCAANAALLCYHCVFDSCNLI